MKINITVFSCLENYLQIEINFSPILKVLRTKLRKLQLVFQKYPYFLRKASSYYIFLPIY